MCASWRTKECEENAKIFCLLEVFAEDKSSDAIFDHSFLKIDQYQKFDHGFSDLCSKLQCPIKFLWNLKNKLFIIL